MGKLRSTRDFEADQHSGRHRPRTEGWGCGAGLTAQGAGRLRGLPRPLARYRERWEPRVAAIRAAIQGDEAAEEAVHRLLERLSQTDGWRSLAAALHQVLDGDRDAGALAEEPDLDATDCLILSKVLEALEAGGEAPLPGSPPRTTGGGSCAPRRARDGAAGGGRGRALPGEWGLI